MESIGTISADHLEKFGRPFCIAIDEAGQQFHNVDDFKVVFASPS